MKNNATGSLQIKASAATDALPIKNAVVKITGSDEYNGEIKYSLQTDNNGLTRLLELPAVSKEFSLNYGEAEKPYTSYDIVLSKEGFYTKRIVNVPIFEGIRAVLPVEMIPIAYNINGDVAIPENINSEVTEQLRGDM